VFDIDAPRTCLIPTAAQRSVILLTVVLLANWRRNKGFVAEKARNRTCRAHRRLVRRHRLCLEIADRSGAFRFKDLPGDDKETCAGAIDSYVRGALELA
jgi:hypothetical protein